MTATPGTAPWWMRVLFVVGALAAYFSTQALIGARPDPDGDIGDRLHYRLAAANRYLHEHPGAATALLICSSAVIDMVGLFLLGMALFGRTVRPFLGLLLLFAMRQTCQMLCPLRGPTGMIWHDPGVPSLFVTYSVSTDFFFSGHTGLAVLGAVEVVRILGRRWLFLGIFIALFEALTVLVLRAHYTMDVFTGAVVALYVATVAAVWAPWCDDMLAHLSGRAKMDGEGLPAES